MALSREYTFWHLTPNGWVQGDSKTDSGKWQKPTPNDTVLTIKYEETLGSNFHLSKHQERYEISDDKEYIKSLENKFPFEFTI